MRTLLLILVLSTAANAQSRRNSLSGPRCDTDTIVVGHDAIYAWSQELDGSACRYFNGVEKAGTVRVEVDIRSGGYDAGVARNTGPVKVDDARDAPPLRANLRIDLSGEGHWWAGPKFVICREPEWVSLDGNWECYIIESADLPPTELMAMMQATYRGRQVVNGRVYLHYTKPWESWQQAIAIRETYGDEPSMPFAPLVRYWRENLGVPNWYLHSPKVGLETTGDIRGSFEWSNIQTTDITQ